MNERPFIFPKNSKDAMQVEQKILRSLLTPMDGETRYLDIGCHTGERTLERANLLGAAVTVGVDLISQRLSGAQENLQNLVCADVNSSLPFRDHTFNVITATQVIEDLVNPDEFLEEVKRLISPEGYAIITTNNLAALHHRVELLIGRQPRCTSPSQFSHPPAEDGTYSGHRSLFTYNHLKYVFQQHEFEVIESGTHTIYPLPTIISQQATQRFPNTGAYSYFKVAPV